MSQPMSESRVKEKRGIEKTKKARKRGQGEGSIYKRNDGRWTAAITLGYQGGKLKRKSFYGKTREEVQAKLIATLNDQKKGLPIITERQTLAQFLQMWLAEVAKQSVRPKTYKTYDYIVKLHIEPALGKKALVKLSPQDAQRFLNDKLKSGLSARTVRHINDTLRCALNVALRWGLVSRNVATLVGPPRIQRKEIRSFTPEEAKTFLETIKGDRLEALFSVALSLGLRQGEALGLRWQDVDFDARTLRVNYAIQRIEGRLQMVEPKTERSRRVLPLPETVLSALRTHRSRQLEERLLLGSHWQETGLVFTSTIGTPLEPRNVVRKFHALLKKAGLPHSRFHDLRHSCASLLLAQGVPARTVMDILGHSQISLTMNTYAHVMPAMKQEAMDLMDSILTGRK
jgi:integrase